MLRIAELDGMLVVMRDESVAGNEDFCEEADTESHSERA